MSRSLKAAIVATAAGGALAVSALAPAPAQAQAPKKVVTKTTVSVYGVTIDTSSGEQRFGLVGKVTAKKQKKVCRKGRTVTVTVNGSVDRDRSDGLGIWQVSFGEEALYEAPELVFRVKVARKVVKKKGLKVVCKAAATTYTMPLSA